ncbi:MAG: hypothetical protein WA040_18035 [Anaerolineae bacterium]
MKTQVHTLLGLCVLLVALLALSGAASAAPLAGAGDVSILDGFCDCSHAARMAVAPADHGQEVDMAVVHARRYRAEQAAQAAAEAVKQVDIAQLRADRDQAMQDAAALVAAANQGAEVDMALVASRRYQAERLAHAVMGAEMALARAGRHM